MPAALAAAGDRHPAGVDRRVRPDRLDRADRVGEDPAVVVRRRDPGCPGHEARLRRRPRRRPGRACRRSNQLDALTARVHHQVGVARDRPEDPFVRPGRGRRRSRRTPRRRAAARAHRAAGGASPGSASRRSRANVTSNVSIDRQVVVDRLEGRIERVAAGVRERRRPEVVEVGGPGQVGSIGAELVEWQVELRHGGLPYGLDPDSMERPTCRPRVASTGSA